MKASTEQLAEQFCACTLPKPEWTHYAHLKVGLWHLLHYPADESMTRLRQGIKKYNVVCGVENTENQGYHETITQFYVVIIDCFLQQADRNRPIDTLADELIACRGDKSLPFEYYSRDRLFSKTARLEWLEPDLKPLK
ncbi:MAG: hypothetical protein F6J87_17545 [Spirulina sp. SIO3F2]|nr:hypothetical protein [Spirulina sp. SIO3F2]